MKPLFHEYELLEWPIGEQRIYCDKGAHHNSPIILPQLEVVVHWQTGSWMLNVIHVMIVGIEGGKNLMQMLTYPGDGYGCCSSIRGLTSGGECLSSPCPTLPPHPQLQQS
jgi:hypothetical protein